MASKKKSVNFGDDVISESQFRKVDKDSRDRSKGEGVKVIDISGREQRVITGINRIFDDDILTE